MCERKRFVKGFEHPEETIEHEPHYSETHQPMFAREAVRGHQCGERTLGQIAEASRSVNPNRRM